MKKWLIKNKLWFIGGLVGSIGGFVYYYFIGCSSGSCAITSNPINSTLYGLIMGAILFSMFEKKPESKNNV